MLWKLPEAVVWGQSHVKEAAVTNDAEVKIGNMWYDYYEEQQDVLPSNKLL